MLKQKKENDEGNFECLLDVVLENKGIYIFLKKIMKVVVFMEIKIIEIYYRWYVVDVVESF